MFLPELDVMKGGEIMGLLETIAIILVVAWLLGFGFHIAGGLIHILLVLAIVVFLLRFIRRSTV
jgi:hypothetical protein